VAEEEEETIPLPTLIMAAATTKSPEHTQLTMLMDMVKGLQATMTELKRNQVDRRAP